MSIRSRFQASPAQASAENPNLTPLPPQIDPWASRGRFQQVNLGVNPAEERTRVVVQPDARFNTSKPSNQGDKKTTTTTTVKSNTPDVVKKEETTTTIIE